MPFGMPRKFGMNGLLVLIPLAATIVGYELLTKKQRSIIRTPIARAGRPILVMLNFFASPATALKGIDSRDFDDDRTGPLMRWKRFRAQMELDQIEWRYTCSESL